MPSVHDPLQGWRTVRIDRRDSGGCLGNKACRVAVSPCLAAMQVQGVAMARLSFKEAETAASIRAATAVVVKGYGEALPDLDDSHSFGATFDRFADARIVLLGESTHGTSEFYRARAAITQRLIERHGFTIVAVEADWPDAARIDALCAPPARRPTERRSLRSASRSGCGATRRSPISSIGCATITGTCQEDRRAEFRGLDVYSLNPRSGRSSTISTGRSRAAATHGAGATAVSAPGRQTRPATAAPCSRRAEEALRRGPPPQLQDLLDRRLDYLQADRQRVLLRRGPERPDRPLGRALLPHHVRRLDGILEPARPAYVRHASEPSWPARDEAEGGRLGAQLPYRQRGRHRYGLAGGVQYRRALPHRLPGRRGPHRLWHRSRHRGGGAATGTRPWKSRRSARHAPTATSASSVIRALAVPADWRANGQHELKEALRGRAWSGPSG